MGWPVAGQWQLRAWQAEVLPLAWEALRAGRAGVVSAVTGSGKSVVIAELAARLRQEGQRVLVSTPRQALVEQLAETVARAVGETDVGRWYQHEQRLRPVTVTTLASIDRLPVEQLSQVVWIADEVHRTESERLHKVIRRIQPAWRIGFSATPYRASGAETLRLWEDEIYRYGPSQALAAGVIVPWEIRPWAGAETTVDEAIAEMARQTKGPGLVNASSIEDAEAYAEYLSAEGIPAQAIHSGLSRAERQQVLDRLRVGEIRAAVHVALLVDGVDLPWIRWMGLRRPVRSRVRFVQEVGRGLRVAEGKSRCVYLDPLGLFAAFSLTYDAALGWIEGREAEGERDGRDGRARPRSAAEVLRTWGWSAVDAYLRQLAVVSGADNGGSPVVSPAWRLDVPTERQRAAVRRLAWATEYVAGPAGRWLAELLAAGGPWTRGGTSDALGVLVAAAQARRRGERVLEGVEVSEPPQIEAEGDGERIVWLGIAARRGRWSAAAVCDGRVIWMDSGTYSRYTRMVRTVVMEVISAAGSGGTLYTERYWHDTASWACAGTGWAAERAPDGIKNPAAAIAWRRLARGGE